MTLTPYLLKGGLADGVLGQIVVGCVVAAQALQHSSVMDQFTQVRFIISYGGCGIHGAAEVSYCGTQPDNDL
jgi:NADH:ubiquinone oxidoreductase subunit B-like Fe-S oxidoreductase